MELNELEFLKISIKNTFSKPLNSIKSFEELAHETNVSSQTLRRFFGKIDNAIVTGKQIGRAHV